MANGSEHRDGDGDGDGEAQQQDTRPVGFWDKELNAVRKEVFTKWALTSLCFLSLLLVQMMHFGERR